MRVKIWIKQNTGWDCRFSTLVQSYLQNEIPYFTTHTYTTLRGSARVSIQHVGGRPVNPRKATLQMKLISTCPVNAVTREADENLLSKIWICIPYLKNWGNFPLKCCLNKIQRFLSKPVTFVTIFDTNFLLCLAVIWYTKLLALVVAKPILAWRLSVRLKEHSTRLSSSAVGQLFSECELTQLLATLQDQFSILNNNPLPLNNPFPIENLVFNIYRILHVIYSNNYHILAFLKALLIKHNKPLLNTGLKASKELQLFT